jgi:solute carrier family 66, member 2
MGWFTDLTGTLAPVFIIASPILSYSDQALSMQRNKTSAGFSLDIPLIMLVASFLRSETSDSSKSPARGR